MNRPSASTVLAAFIAALALSYVLAYACLGVDHGPAPAPVFNTPPGAP